MWEVLEKQEKKLQQEKEIEELKEKRFIEHVENFMKIFIHAVDDIKKDRDEIKRLSEKFEKMEKDLEELKDICVPHPTL